MQSLFVDRDVERMQEATQLSPIWRILQLCDIKTVWNIKRTNPGQWRIYAKSKQ